MYIVWTFIFLFIFPYLFIFWNISVLFFLYLFLLLFKYSYLHFSSSTPHCLIHPHLPPSILTPFGFVHMSFIHVPWRPFPFSPHYPLPPPLWLLSDCSLYMYESLYTSCEALFHPFKCTTASEKWNQDFWISKAKKY